MSLGRLAHALPKIYMSHITVCFMCGWLAELCMHTCMGKVVLVVLGHMTSDIKTIIYGFVTKKIL